MREKTILLYEFETVSADPGGYSLFGGVGLATEGHREIIRRRAEAGWRLAACIPTAQRAGGFIEAWDLIFEKEQTDGAG